uniref:Uncharacterized protein n=1 Tax=Dictyoglomus turgidum TaxID=513050 RepID=A0A7C3WLC7_9BACT
MKRKKVSNRFAVTLNNLLRRNVASFKKEALSDNNIELIKSETIGEVIEKLIILNIRIWILEDLAAEAKQKNNISKYVDLKKKLDICFKIKRPMLVTALNKMFESIAKGDLDVCKDGNIKLYNNE